MIFSSLQFLIFWSLIVYLNKFNLIRTPLSIGIIGLCFYSFQGVFNFLVLFYIFLVICISHRLIHKTYILIALVLLPLFIIKYLNFILESVFQLDLNISFLSTTVIPPGLSFISFSAIALIYYLKENKEKFDINLSYLYLFPQLIAGPIVRPKELIPQIKFVNKSLNLNKDISLGLFIFSIGILIKVFIADSISDYIDPTFSNLENEKFSKKMIALFLFSQQIFFDFNGYTLMAIGIGKTLGINLPENFNAPYLSSSITNFWKRWHITLSSWIRDYIFIPLGGSRNGVIKNYANILIAMVISGIWHGAGFNFLIWGLAHGLFIVLEKVFGGLRIFHVNIYIKILFTYLIVTLLWLFFRVENLNDIKLFFLNYSFNELLDFNIFLFLLSIFILNYFQKFLTIKFLNNLFNKINKIFAVIFSIATILFCIIISDGSSQKFIYFNF